MAVVSIDCWQISLAWTTYTMQHMEMITTLPIQIAYYRSSPPDVFLGKVFWKYAANLPKNTHAEVVLHGCSPVNLLHIFRTPFPRNTSGWLLLILYYFQADDRHNRKAWAPLLRFYHYSSVLNCKGGQISRGVGVPEKYLKIMGEGLTLREHWDYTTKWGAGLTIKWGGSYDFYISAFTGNG